MIQERPGAGPPRDCPGTHPEPHDGHVPAAAQHGELNIFPISQRHSVYAAFPFQKYGLFDGRVEHVGADAADPAAAPGGPSNPGDRARGQPLLYKARVTLQGRPPETGGGKLDLTAGMQVAAEIHLGTRTVMEYLLSPVQKAWHEAGRER